MPQAPPPGTARRLPSPLATLLAALGALLALMLLAPHTAMGQSPTPGDSPSPRERAVLGIMGFTAPQDGGVAVARVLPGSGADEAGLQTGDLIVELEGDPVRSMEELASAIAGFNVGDEVTVTYRRNNESRTAEVELGEETDEGQRSPFEAIPDPGFGPNFPDRPGAPPNPNPVSAPDYRPVIILFGVLITGALIALAVILARKNRPAGETPVETAAYVPAGAGERADPLDVLRLRYAQGEITREQFLTMSADLNGGPSSGSPEAPTEQ